MHYFTTETDFSFDIMIDTESKEQSVKEIVVMGKINSLVTKTQNNPAHSLVDDILATLSEIIEPINRFYGEEFHVHESIGPLTLENVFSHFRDIIMALAYVEMNDYFDVSFRDKTDRLKSYAEALVWNMDYEVSMFRGGDSPERRLEELLDLLSQLADSSDTAAIIRGAKRDELWSRLVQVADVEELLPEEYEECCICTLVTITEDVNFTILSGCRHLLCQPCARTWFEMRSTCPLCRQEVSKFASSDEFAQFKRDQRALEKRWSIQTR